MAPSVPFATPSLSSTDDEMLRLTIAQTVATYIGLIALFLTIAGLVNQRYIRLRNNDIARIVTQPSRVGLFTVPKPSYLDVLLGRMVKLPLLPTIEGLIQFAELGLWTSGTLHRIRADPMRVGWVQLYQEIFTEIAGLSELDLLALCGMWPELRTYVDKTRAHPSAMKALRFRNKLYANNEQRARLIKFLRPYDIEILERETHASDSFDTVLSSKAQPIWLLSETSPCIPLSSHELITLSYILGLPLSVNDFTQKIRGSSGGFSSSLEISRPGSSSWDQAHFAIGSSHPEKRPQCTTGYSILNAKAIACGNLVFGTNRFWYLSVFVNDAVLRAVKEGRAVTDRVGHSGKAMETLWTLPGAKEVNAYFHAEEDWDVSRIGGIYGINRSPVILQSPETSPNMSEEVNASIPFCVALLAFTGGLVPQASIRLIEAVSFTVLDTAEGNISFIDELEALLSELCTIWRREHPSTGGDMSDVETVFGTDMCKRCTTADFIDLDHFVSRERLTPAEGTIVFHRYSLLLEALAARVNPHEKGLRFTDQVQQNSQSSIRMSNKSDEKRETLGVNDKPGGETSTTLRIQENMVSKILLNDVFRASLFHINDCYLSAVKSYLLALSSSPSSSSSPRPPAEFISSLPNPPTPTTNDLATYLQTIRSKLRHAGSISVREMAIVVRAVIAAWAVQVAAVEWDNEVEVDQGDSKEVPKIRRRAEIGDLPPVCGLC